MDDANYLPEIRNARQAGTQWLEATSGLGAAQWRAVADADIDPEALRGFFELPWGLTDEHDRKPDRSDEIEHILGDVEASLEQLARVEHVAATSSHSAYRGRGE